MEKSNDWFVQLPMMLQRVLSFLMTIIFCISIGDAATAYVINVRVTAQLVVRPMQILWQQLELGNFLVSQRQHPLREIPDG